MHSDRRSSRSFLWLTVGVLIALAGCQTAYYGALETIGFHKRDLLVRRVDAARDSQVEAKEQFESALDAFTSVTGYQGGELEEVYRRLNRELQKSEARAIEVSDRINAVEDVAEDLFDEWSDELDAYESAELRRASRAKLDATRRRYEDLLRAMRRAEARLEPALQPMRDQVLYLKHNLNAQAIAALESELGAIQGDVTELVQELNAAIREAEQFVAQTDLA